jgi:nucleoporin SEH1
LATCSSDQHVKVFDKDTATNSWELSDSWKAHDSAIVKVCWAAPEFGQIIATCSHDATVRIFEEDPREPVGSGKRWKRKHTISDFRGPLYDIEFAPSHLGLKLASIGSDGVFRVHEALDPNSMNYWTTAAEVNMLTNPVARQLQSSFALSWCPSMFFKEFIVACVLEDAFIYQKDYLGKYVRVAQLNEHKGLIRDVAWAPSMGRGYQLIATASKDGYVRIFKVTSVERNLQYSGSGASSDLEEEDVPRGTTPLKVELLSEFDDHQGEVWRVSWNLTGKVPYTKKNPPVCSYI